MRSKRISSCCLKRENKAFYGRFNAKHVRTRPQFACFYAARSLQQPYTCHRAGKARCFSFRTIEMDKLPSSISCFPPRKSLLAVSNTGAISFSDLCSTVLITQLRRMLLNIRSLHIEWPISKCGKSATKVSEIKGWSLEKIERIIEGVSNVSYRERNWICKQEKW